jgi:hypothetical protein
MIGLNLTKKGVAGIGNQFIRENVKKFADFVRNAQNTEKS